MKDDTLKKGSCLCGGIQFEYVGALFDFALCHCKMCRKFSGGPFSSFVGLKKDKFKYTKGEQLETIFSSSHFASRAFCSKCGASLAYFYHKRPDTIFISAGLFDDEIAIQPEKHIFVKDKCLWFDIADNLPQHDDCPY